MRALVTGGAGFIGSYLTERLLAEGHAVDVVDDLSGGSLGNLAAARAASDRQLTFHQLDVRSDALVDLVARRHPDVVFHLAGCPGAGPVTEASVTVVGTVQVLEAAKAAAIGKVVVASDTTVATRAAADYVRAYRQSFDLESTVLVLANVYGPRRTSGVVAEFARCLAAGRPCHVFGDGRQVRDFVFVDDVVDALARAADRGDGLALDIGTGVGTSIRDLYETMASVAGINRPAASAPSRPDDPASVVLDPGRAAIHLGWRPWTDLRTGLAAVLS